MRILDKSERSGATMVEYALLVTLVAVASIAGLSTLETSVDEALCNAQNYINDTRCVHYGAAYPGAVDVTPDDVVFNAVSGAATSSIVSSNTVTITGISKPVFVEVSELAQISISGGPWQSSGMIAEGQELQVRVTTPATPFSSISPTVKIGTRDFTFTVSS